VGTTGDIEHPEREADGLPYLDEHTLSVAASRDVVWSALHRHVAASLLLGDRSPLVLLLGTVPRGGFEVSESSRPDRLILAGRHRFSRYRLAFELVQAPGGTTLLRARSYAAFPGVHGRVYRALVIDTRLHVLATTRILRSVRRLSLASAAPNLPA
jgi:hypothetical protein